MLVFCDGASRSWIPGVEESNRRTKEATARIHGKVRMGRKRKMEERREDELRSMISEAFSKEMLSSWILLWVFFIPFLALAIFSAVKFFASAQVKDLILFAGLFVCCNVWTVLIKLWGYHMANRHGIRREIKRLEARIAELNETVKSK